MNKKELLEELELARKYNDSAHINFILQKVEEE